MSKHTPGPWTIDGFNMAAVIHCTKERGHPDAKHLTGDYEQIARCEGENWKANARLIAAAPELLEALSNLLNCVDGQHDDEWLDRVKQKALAAITKATGAA